MSSKYWCFTENSEARTFWTNLGDLFERESQIKYICGQLEQGSHLHFQGMVQLKVSQKPAWVKNHISATMHFKKQQGTSDQAKHYTRKPVEGCECKHCIKEREEPTVLPNTFIEFGTFQAGVGGRGARNDIHQLRDAIKQGKSQRTIINDDGMVSNYAKHLKFHDRVRSLFPPPERPDGVELILYYGHTRTGKTRTVKALEDVFEIPISNGTLWLDGYDDHENVLFDDFCGKGSKLGLDNTLKFFDRYVRQVPVKGTHVWYRPKRIHVTTNFHPRGWYDYSNREEHWNALVERFTTVWVYEKGQEPYETDVKEFMNNEEYWPEPTQPQEIMMN